MEYEQCITSMQFKRNRGQNLVRYEWQIISTKGRMIADEDLARLSIRYRRSTIRVTDKKF